MAVLGQLLEDAVRIVDRRRHQVRGLVAGEAEHDALVAGAFILVAGLIDALGDVGRLAVQVAGEVGILPVEAMLLVADPLHRLAYFRLDVGNGRRHFELAAHLAGQHDPVGRDERFAGDARFRIAADEQIDDRVGNLVGDLVRMAFGHRFGREEVVAAHRWARSFWGKGVADIKISLCVRSLACLAPYCNRRRGQQQREDHGEDIAVAGEQGRRRGAGRWASIAPAAPSGRLCRRCRRRGSPPKCRSGWRG
jgi:hypothetical protein